MLLTILLWIASIVAIIIALAVALCLPPVRTALTWIAVFFVTYAPSIITIILVLSALVMLLALPAAAVTAFMWWIYGPALLVLAMLAIFAIWSSFAKWLLWAILVIGLILSFFYQPANTWLHKELPALTGWQETSKEKANIKIQESSLSMKNEIRDSEVTVGTFGKMNKNSVGYDDFGHEANGPTIKTGQAVKSMGKIKPQNKENGDQGLMQIALPNLKTDEFVNVRVVWVPIQSVTWEKMVKEEEKKVTVTPPPSVVVPPRPVVAPVAPAVTPTSPPVQKVAPPPVHVVTPKEAQLARVRAGQEQQGWVESPQQRRVYYPEPWQYRQERRYHHEPPRHRDRYYDQYRDRW